jgi:hypothetical protein
MLVFFMNLIIRVSDFPGYVKRMTCQELITRLPAVL